MSDNDRVMDKAVSYIGKTHTAFLRDHSNRTSLAMSRLIGILIDNEMMKDNPFADIDITLPDDEYEEYAFAKESGMILDFIRKSKTGMSLDMIYILRHDIGVPDKGIFLAAFRECLEKKTIESFAIEQRGYMKYKNGATFYRATENSPVVRKKQLTKAQRYDKLQKLRKEFKE